MVITNSAKNRELEQINDGDVVFVDGNYFLALNVGAIGSRTYANLKNGECDEMIDEEVLDSINSTANEDNLVTYCELLVSETWN